ncbi:MAG: hypothetical protein HUJ93_06920, partial [Bacteroidales bacterium]|nr:hypothetical protein [Bacteroidales bacterium]
MKLKHYMFAFLVAMLCLCIEAKGQETGDSTAVNTMERIIRFHSDLVLNRDNKMEVTEHIRIYAKGEVFIHGLKRSIPHKRPLPSGVRLEVPIDIMDVKCNGEAAQYDTETDGDNVVV